jgi:hydroxymethylglutaryl-CoA lyase
VCTDDLVHYLHEEGHSTGIDLDALIRAAWLLEETLGRPLQGQVMRAGKRLWLHDANIPLTGPSNRQNVRSLDSVQANA